MACWVVLELTLSDFLVIKLNHSPTIIVTLSKIEGWRWVWWVTFKLWYILACAHKELWIKLRILGIYSEECKINLARSCKIHRKIVIFKNQAFFINYTSSHCCRGYFSLWIHDCCMQRGDFYGISQWIPHFLWNLKEIVSKILYSWNNFINFTSSQPPAGSSV